MNPKKTKRRIGIVISIFTAFMLVSTVSPRLFIANSPQINRQFIAELRYIPSDLIAMVRNPLQKAPSQDEMLTNQIPNITHPQGIQLQQIAKGVYASEPDESGKRFIKIDKGTNLEIREVTLEDGRTVKVYIPVE
ncbi:MAG: hypothetical protein Q8P72_05995 [Candidatus Roizmanbacteria bacterium]|nr:hypothetical protein [Candidatus Roizmanbacteria bacterium]